MKKILLGFVSLFIMGSVFAQSNDTVNFKVDMSKDSTFNPAIQDVYISGTMTGWAQPGSDATYKLTPDATDSIYSITFMEIADGEIQYKYFLIDSTGASWDNGEWTGDPNRYSVIVGNTTLNDTWADKPSVVTFKVDMTNDSTLNLNHDQVYIAGDLANSWAEPGTITYYAMSPNIDSTIFSITLRLYTGDYQYKYFIVTDSIASWDNGEWAGDPNRTVTITDTTTVINNTWGIIGNSGINTYTAFPSFNIYPNPVSNILYIDNLKYAKSIEIFNLVGQKVKVINEVTASKLSIPINDLNKGIYVITVFGNNNHTRSLKFLKK